MPATSDSEYIANLVRQLEAVFADAETVILQNVATQAAKGIDNPQWQTRQLNNVVALRSDMIRLQRALLIRSDAEVRRIVEEAFSRGSDRAAAELRVGGVAGGAEMTAGASFGNVNLDAIEALISTARRSLGSMIMSIAPTSERIYADVVMRTASLALSGVGTRRQLAARALREWAQRGVTGFTDRAGRNWELASYAEMTTRTTATQAIIAGHVNQLSASGEDLVMISDAPEECQRCRPWEGRVLSISGDTPAGDYTDEDGGSYHVDGTLDEAKIDGLFHPNCRHRTGAYFPNITRRFSTPTEDPEGNKLRVEQRAKERRVRQLKREVAVLQGVDDDAARLARQNLRAYQAEFRDWREANDRKNLSYRTSIVSR